MSSPASDFSHLIQRAADSDHDAFTRLFDLYNPSLVAQLRIHLRKFRCLRSLVEPEDLAQNIWVCFVTGALRRCRFPTPAHMLRYLARAASNEIRKVARHHLGVQKRDPRRCQSLSETVAGTAAFIMADPSPLPERIAEFRDECEAWLRSMTVQQEQVARMVGTGFSLAAIAACVGCSERTIERMVGEIRQVLPLANSA